jgi:hypothetical protein
MSILLDRVNSAPLMNNDFPYEFNQWVFNTIDALNENFDSIDNVIISQTLVPIATTAVNVEVNSLYISSAASLTTFQLPVVTAEDIGSIIEITGFGAGGWKLLAGAGTTIKVPTGTPTSGTSISSATRYDSIRIILVDATTWNTLSAQTIGFVIA